jgi:two-component system, chemotaxis family, CheB/CheR fusion protein
MAGGGRLESMSNDPSGDEAITVVGIGASAGGLGALRELLGIMPDDTGLAFVIVMHLAPDHESHLADVLQPHSRMPIQQVSETLLVERNHVYVIPPNRNLSAIDSHLRLDELEQATDRRHSIDHFFRTLADVHDGRSIGVVLSGTGTDGTVGLSMIRAHGGLTIAQDPNEAEYDGMPRSAIRAESVDLILPLAEIAERLADIAKATGTDLSAFSEHVATKQVRSTLNDILTLVHERCGHDLSRYKESTILRRVQRRAQLHRMTDLNDYVEFVRNEPGEADLLFNDLLIPVTNFFRDAGVFDELARRVIPKLFDGKSGDDQVRAWSVGCSTGEEAYSIAILLLEHADTLTERPHLQVFASDLLDASLERARHGVYPASIESDVSPERLRRFFTRRGDDYEVNRIIRDMVVFAKHDVLSDPPFSHTDLVSCRNLLIYLQREAQRDVVSLFHYSLEPGGVLFLGTSESVDRPDLFSVIDKKSALFERRNVALREPPRAAFRSPSLRARARAERNQVAPEVGYERLHRSLLERYGPPSVLLDGSNRVVQYSSEVGQYLSHPGGPPTNDVFQLVADDLRLEMRSVVYAARNEHCVVVSRPVTTMVEGTMQTVMIRVVPVADDDVVLVMFEQVPGPSSERSSVEPADDLGRQLEEANRRLESVIEQYEVSQEEMTASNEELQSTNEELRSTMEELETSKEELQSTNEELATLNQENRHKVEELAMLSSDLQNLLTATDIATIFLDRQLRIVRFTPPITQIFNIVHDDRGRPLTDFTNRLGGHQLAADAERVLDRLVPVEYEVRSDDDRWLLTRILPYRTSDDRIEGVVITFVDITRRWEAESSLRASERGLRMALDAAEMGTWWWNEASGASGGDARAYEILMASPDDVGFADVLAERLAEDERRRWWDYVSNGSERDAAFELTGATTSIHIQLNVGDVDADDEVDPVASRRGTIRDVTADAEVVQSLAERSRRLTLLADAAAQLLRGSAPESLLAELFGEMSEVLGLEIYERFEIDEHGTARRVEGSVGWSAPDGDEPGGADIGPAYCSRAIETGAPVVHTGLDLTTGVDHALERREGLTAYGCFPLIAAGEVIGALAFATRGPASFEPESIELIRTIVDYLAVAELRRRTEHQLREINRSLASKIRDATSELIESEAQLRTLASDLVRAEHSERRRVADMLHDDVQQLLFGAQMRLELLREDVVEGRLADVDAHLDEADRYIAESIDRTRHLTVELAPPSLDDDDLADTIQSLVAQMREIHGLDVDMTIGSPLIVPDRTIRIVVHQTIRELLFNVVKHADVRRADVDVTVRDGELDVHVSDGGRGFDIDKVVNDPSQVGLGLATLRQRLSVVGGSLTIESVPGDGTKVRVRLPADAAFEVAAHG